MKFKKLMDVHKKTPTDDYLDPDYLTYLRIIRGKTKEDMAQLFSCGKLSYSRYEGKGMSRWTMGIAKLRLLCNYFHLDPLELCKLLKYSPWEERITKKFKDACVKNNQSVNEVFKDFMEMYSKEVLGK